MATSHTQRTLQLLRNEGYKAFVTERWILAPGMPGGGVRRDVGGFMDILAWGCGRVLAVQCCPGGGINKHMSKYREDPAIKENILSWLQYDNTAFVIYGWRKLKIKRGGKAMYWAPKIVYMTKEDFDDK